MPSILPAAVTVLLPLPLAHAGEGASWQALVMVFGCGAAIVALLATFGKLRVKSFDDLVLPLAGVAILSSLAPLLSDTLSDLVGWGIPLGVAGVVAMMAFAIGKLDDAPRQQVGSVVMGIGIVATILFHGQISRAVHPVAEDALAVDDIDLTLTAPVEGATVDTPVTLQVEISGGSVGAPEDVGERLSDDPEELGFVVVFLDGVLVNEEPRQTCTREAPCTSLTYELDLSPGEHTLTVEFRPSGNRLFAIAIFDRVAFTVAN